MKHFIYTTMVLLLISTFVNAQSLGTGSTSHHTMVVNNDGAIYTWGANYQGQLGNGSTANSNVPVAVTTSGVLSGKTITAVAGGGSHSLALASDGRVYSWGRNCYGQLGNGNSGNYIYSNVPVAVTTSGVLSGKTITAVAGGRDHSLALASDGRVYSWGVNYDDYTDSYGQLGDGSTTNRDVPVAVITSGVLSGKMITAVAAGRDHSLALASDGTVYTWGGNDYGQLGDGTTYDRVVPVAVVTSGVLSGKTITAVAAGRYHSLALASDGTVYTWGRNNYGQLGNGSTADSNVPVAVITSGVLSGKMITAVAAGYEHSLALASDGTVYTWGNSASNVPVAISAAAFSGKTITVIAAGYDHSVAFASDGTVYTWGSNKYGQLGNGTNTHSNVPVLSDGIYYTEYNNALNFDGLDDYVEVDQAVIPTSGDFTVSLWAKANSVQDGHRALLSQLGGFSFGKHENGSIRVCDWNITNQSFPLDDTWHFYTIVKSSTNTHFYMDGELKATRGSTIANPSGAVFRIARQYGIDKEYFKGEMDEVRIWNTARTAMQIRDNMCRSLVGTESGLVVYYEFKNSAGTSLYDLSSNDKHGTLMNMSDDDWVHSESFTTWTGRVNSAWNLAGNWSNGIPTTTANVGIVNAVNTPILMGTPTLNHCVISSGAEVTLNSGFTVNGNLILENNLDLNGQIITLDSTATLVEGSGRICGNTGYIQATRILNNIDENVAGLGARITSSANMGSTTIKRGTLQTNGNKNSIRKYFDIMPTNNLGLDAILVFHYRTDELNGLNESNLELSSSSDAGASWMSEGGTVDADNNTIALDGINSFSRFTLFSTATPIIYHNAIDFDGIDDYVQVDQAVIPTSGDFTVSLWAKANSVQAGYRVLLSQSGGFYFGKHENGSIRVCDWIITDPGFPLDDTWHFYTIVKSSSNTHFYMDGELKATRGSAIANPTGAEFRIGCQSDSHREYFKGEMDEVRIWNTARTARQIRENMCRSLAGTESGLVAYYKFKNSAGTTLNDLLSGNKYGTLMNMSDDDWVPSESFTTWTGNESRLWDLAGNWSDGIPTAAVSVGIVNTANTPILTGTPTLNHCVIGSGAEVTFNSEFTVDGNLMVGSGAEVTLNSGFTVNGNLILEENLNLNGHIITLGATSTLVERDGHIHGTTGHLQTTRVLNNIHENVAGLGVKIISSANMGSTTIRRGHTAQTNGNKNSINRYFDIMPTNNTELDATLVFHYRTDELNGLHESDLELSSSYDAGGSWIPGGGIVDTNNNTIALGGIDRFLRFTLFSNVSHNNALDFDGEDDYVQVDQAVIPTSGDFTVSLWAKANSVQADDRALLSQSGGFYFGKSSDSSIRVCGWNITDPGFPLDDIWHFYTIVKSSTNTHFYMDGELKATKGSTIANPSGTVFRIGCQYGTVGEYFKGEMDEVRIWNTARTARQIRENMCRSLAGTENGLVAYYKFINSDGTSLYDLSSDNKYGTLMNMSDDDWVHSESFTTWTGDTSSTWNLAGNWSNGIPTATSNVGIVNTANTPILTGTPTLNHCVIGRGAEVTLNSGFTVTGNLILENNLDLNGQIITLDSTATLIEGSGGLWGTTGHIQTTRILNNINENIAGLGASITSSANMGSTIIKRGHTVHTSGDKNSIRRYFDIMPTNNTGLDATLAFHYRTGELNWLYESDLELSSSSDAGTSWISEGGILDAENNTVALSGIDDFSRFTLFPTVISIVYNNALDFDGVDDYVQVDQAVIPTSGDFTVSLWAKANSVQDGYRELLSQSGGFYFGKHTNGSIRVCGWNITDPGFPLDEVWHFYTIVKSSTNTHFYMDGELKATRGSAIANPSGTVFRIGRQSETIGEYFKGEIDEVRIWNTARTARQIRENMCRSLAGAESGLVAYYKIKNSVGTTLNDLLSDNKYGILMNMSDDDWVHSESFTTWTGDANSTWNLAGNWSNGIPTATSNVGIANTTNTSILTGTPTLNNCVVNSGAEVTLNSGFTVTGNLILENSLDLNGQIITLGATATLIEGNGHLSGAAGYIQTTRILNNIDENIAGLGAKIISSANMGSTTIKRGHTVQISDDKNSIKRYFDITPTNNTALDATLVFHYRTNELNGLHESGLELSSSSDAGASWISENGILDAENNMAALSGIDNLSRFTLFFIPLAPTLSTQAVTNIAAMTATAHGDISDLGSPDPTAYGVCWNTTGMPTLSDSSTNEGASVVGSFTSSLSGLLQGTTYYVRAYAINSVDTVYGDEVNFTTLEAIVLHSADLVVVGRNTDYDDDFALVALADIPGRSVVFLTDEGWDDSGIVFDGNEDVFKWTVHPNGIPAGSIIRFTNASTTTLELVNSNYGSLESVSGTGDMSLAGGDQLFIYQTVDQNHDGVIQHLNGSGGRESGMVYAFNGDNSSPQHYGWLDSGNAHNIASSQLPDDMTVLTTCDGTGNAYYANGNGMLTQCALKNTYADEYSNYKYDGPITPASKAEWLRRIHTVSNWLASYEDALSFQSGALASDWSIMAALALSTQAVTNIMTTTATGNGNISELGSSDPTAHGVCWNTTGMPTLADSFTNEGAASAASSFTSSISNLLQDTPYYVRAYATNTVGTSYGNQVSFTTNAANSVNWNGTGNWNETSYWSTGSLPATGDNIIVQTGILTVNQHAEVSDLSINNSAAMLIPSGQSLSATGTLTNNNSISGLIIQSDAAGTGQLLNSTAGVQATVQTFLVKDQWHLLGIPVIGQEINGLLTNSSNNIAYKSGTDEYGVSTYNETEDNWSRYFTSATPGNFKNGTAYLFRRETTDGTVSFSGTLATGEVVAAIEINGWLELYW